MARKDEIYEQAHEEFDAWEAAQMHLEAAIKAVSKIDDDDASQFTNALEDVIGDYLPRDFHARVDALMDQPANEREREAA